VAKAEVHAGCVWHQNEVISGQHPEYLQREGIRMSDCLEGRIGYVVGRVMCKCMK
jgi:hypothetical protein